MKNRISKIIIAMFLFMISILIVTACDDNNNSKSKIDNQKNKVEERTDNTNEYDLDENKLAKEKEQQNNKADSKKANNKSSTNNSKNGSAKKDSNSASAKEQPEPNETKENSKTEVSKVNEPVEETEKKKYKITYKKSTNTNGNMPSSQTIVEGETATLANNNTTEKTALGVAYFYNCYSGCNSGYDFYLNSYKVHKSNGWSKTMNSHSCEYSNGQKINADGDLVLYACYSSASEVEGVTFPSAVNPNGSKFGGWYTGQNCSRTKLNEYQGSQSMNFYACWE